MSKLDVNPADLRNVADQYTQLQMAAASIGPQAVDEVNRIIASHGPMGYPVAVGVVAGLAVGRRCWRRRLLISGCTPLVSRSTPPLTKVAMKRAPIGFGTAMATANRTRRMRCRRLPL